MNANVGSSLAEAVSVVCVALSRIMVYKCIMSLVYD